MISPPITTPINGVPHEPSRRPGVAQHTGEHRDQQHLHADVRQHEHLVVAPEHPGDACREHDHEQHRDEHAEAVQQVVVVPRGREPRELRPRPPHRHEERRERHQGHAWSGRNADRRRARRSPPRSTGRRRARARCSSDPRRRSRASEPGGSGLVFVTSERYLAALAFARTRSSERKRREIAEHHTSLNRSTAC